MDIEELDDQEYDRERPWVDGILNELKAHEYWPTLSKVIKLTYSRRERNDDEPHPKFDIPLGMLRDNQHILNIELHCPYCGNAVKVVRQRMTAKRDGVPYPTGGYVSLVCPLSVNAGCCRSNEGEAAVQALEIELRNRVITDL